MAKYQKYEAPAVDGRWVDRAKLVAGEINPTCKLTTEVKPTQSKFLNADGTPKMQDVAKIIFKGEAEPVNINLNRPTLDGLVEAFGEDSAEWVGKVLTAEAEKARIGGKMQIVIYLIPEGFERIDDERGYAHIVPKGKLAKGRPKAEPEDQELPEGF